MTNAQAALLAASIVVAGALSGLLSGGRYEAIGTKRVLDKWTGSQHFPDLEPLRREVRAARSARDAERAPTAQSGELTFEEALARMEGEPSE